MELGDFYAVNVMGGGFRPPSDPMGAEHTLGQLCASVVEAGQPRRHYNQSTDPGIQVDYELDLEWAPVSVKASVETLDPSGPKNFPYFVEISPIIRGEGAHTLLKRPFMFISIARLAEVVARIGLAIVAERDNWEMHSGSARIDSVSESILQRGYVAATAQTYFDQFKGWDKRGDIWVPPTH